MPPTLGKEMRRRAVHGASLRRRFLYMCAILRRPFPGRRFLISRSTAEIDGARSFQPWQGPVTTHLVTTIASRRGKVSAMETNMKDELEAEREKPPQQWEVVTQGSGWASAGRGKVPPEVMPVLKELARPARQGDMPWRIELCQHGLRTMERGQHPWLWAALHDALATSLAQSPSGERAENMERAIEHYGMAMQVRTRQTCPTQWATTQNNLGNA